MDGLSQLSAECYFRPTDVSTVGQLFGSYGRLFAADPFTSAFSLFKIEDRMVAHVTVNGARHSLLSPRGTLVAGSVYHVAITFDGTGADTTLRLYVNAPGTGPNEQVASITLPGKGILTQTDYENVVVGFSFYGWPCAGGGYFNMCGGDLDSIRISNKAVYPRAFKAPDAKLPFVSGQTLVVINGDRVTDSCVILATSSGPFYCPLRRISMKAVISKVEVSDLGFSGGGLDVFLTPDGRYQNLFIFSARYGMRLKNNCFFSAAHNIDMLITSGSGGEFGIENSDASGVNHWSQLKILAKLGFVSYGSAVSLVDANFQAWKDHAAVFSGAGRSNATVDIRNPIVNDEGATIPPKGSIFAFDSVLGAHISGGIVQYIWSKAPLLSVTGPSHVRVVGTTLYPGQDAQEVIHVHPDSAPKSITLVAAKVAQPSRPAPFTKSIQTTIRSVANLFGIVHGCFQTAVYEGILSANPCVLPPGTISTKVTTPRFPYTLEEVHRLTSDPVPWDQLVLNALRFYGGLREGEACGRRFLHWDRRPKPLGSLLVNTQFDDLPLKTSNHQKDRVRMVPVHPELERILDAWWNVHFEEIYGRKPRLSDFIVPRRLGRHTKNTETNHTNSTAGKAFVATCLSVGVNPHTEHATRHTMISECRNNGAPEDVLEQVTHNKKGTIIDAYTLWKWLPLCKAVMAFPMRNGKPALEQLEDPQQRALHTKLDFVLQALGGLGLEGLGVARLPEALKFTLKTSAGEGSRPSLYGAKRSAVTATT